MAICSRNDCIALTAEYLKSAWKLALLVCIINATLHGGIVTIQQGWGWGAEPFKKRLVTQFAGISHLFISTENTRTMLQLHNFPLTRSSENYAAFNILNDVLRWGLVGSLLNLDCFRQEAW